MKYFESYDNFLGSGTQARVYKEDNYAIRVEKSSFTRFEYLKNVYQKLIGKDLNNVVKIYDIKYENDRTIIYMEELINPNFTSVQKGLIGNFVNLIEYLENDFDQAIHKMIIKYSQNVDDGIFNYKEKLKEIETFKPILQQIYNGFIELVNYKIYHLDIKADNIMIDKEGNYKLIDLTR